MLDDEKQTMQLPMARRDDAADPQSPVDLLDRTWHYDCVVGPIHPSASPSSVLDQQLSNINNSSSNCNNNNNNNNNMKRSQADRSDIDDNQVGEDSVKPLRRVKLVVLPATSESSSSSSSSPDGYVSLSRFIGPATDDSPLGNSSRFVGSPLSITTSSASSDSSNIGGGDATCRQEEEGIRAFDGKSHHRHASAFSRRFFNPSRISSLWLAIHN